MSETSAATPTIGRPRRFHDATERSMLLEAAVRVLARSRYGSVSVAEVLSESGLSTRAFYRHFESKEILLETLMLREAEAVGRALRRAVDEAADPVAAVTNWLERFLDVFHEPRRAARAAQLSSAAFQVTRPSVQLMAQMRSISCAPLVDALRAGNAQGLLRSPTPEVDAYSIYNLVTASHDASDGRPTDRAFAKAHVERFAWPALGLATEHA